MWNLKNNIRELIIPSITGHDFICKTSLYIPFKHIGINALVRKEIPLPLEEEMILKLLKLKYKKICDISQFMGIEEDILGHILGEMSLKELIYVKGDIITITPKGENTLKKLFQVIIRQETISLVLDGISGEFSNEQNGKNKIPRGCPCLDTNIIIDQDFLEKNISDIEKQYIDIQSAYNENTAMVSNNQIYQLIDLDYENTVYIEKKLLVYKNSKDDDFSFEISSNENYVAEVRKQITYSSGMKPLLRSKKDVEKYLSNSNDLDSVLQENFDKLNVAIRENCTDIDDLYFKNRLMLDKEYIEILLQIKDIKPQKLYISSSALDAVCTGTVMPGLYNFCDKIPMCIVYDENDYKSKMSAKNISSAKKKINLINDSELIKTQIILYPHCVINIEYVPHFIDGSYILQEIPTIYFDEDIIERESNEFEKRYNYKKEEYKQ